MSQNDANIKPDAIAEAIGVSVSQARAMCASGEIEAVYVNSGRRKHWRVTRAALEAFRTRRLNTKPRELPKLNLPRPTRNLMGI